MGEVIRKTKGGRFLGFYLRWYENGRRRQMASKQPTFAQARRMLQAIEGRVARGLAGLDEPAPADLTVADLAERFLSEYTRPRLKDLVKYRAAARTTLKRVLPFLGKLDVRAVRPSDVAKVRDTLSRRYAPASVNISLVFLQTMFAWAVKTGIATTNPCRGVERPRRTSLLEFLSLEETGRLLLVAKERAPDVFPMIATALHTGLRKGELFGLTWNHIDLASRRLDVMHSYRDLPKGGHPRHLRLPASLVPILRAWRDRCPSSPDGLVFPVEQGGAAQMGHKNDVLKLDELVAAAGCHKLQRPWHALRHTFASHYIMSGGNILALQKILGHSDIKMTLLYAHLAPDYLGDEMDRIKYPS